MNKIIASIIIRSHNEERYIGELLSMIMEQNFRAWEIIVVDSGSTDKTLDVVRQYPIHLIQIPSTSFTFGYSLNVGCRSARGEFLVLVSAHAVPVNESWLTNILQPFQSEKVAMVYGRQLPGPGTPLSEARDYSLKYGMHSRILLEETECNNANSAIRRNLWQQFRFNEKLPGLEDRDWATRVQKAGYYVAYAADAQIYHHHHESYHQIYQRHYREAVAYHKILPERTFTFKYLTYNLTRSALGDLVYGIKEKKSFSKFWSILPYRRAQQLAIYNGMKETYPKVEGQDYLDIIPKQYKAVAIKGPNIHSVEIRKMPKPKDNDVLIKVSFVGVCPTDIEVAEGKLDYYKKGLAKYPVVPGHEFSGVVVDVGKEVTNAKLGDKVVGECANGCGECPSCARGDYFACPNRTEVGVINKDGAYAEYITIPASGIHRLPENITLRRAALIEPLAVSLKGIRKLKPVPGNSAIIVGAGIIGCMCALVLKHYAVHVTIIDRKPERLEIAKNFADEVQTTIGDTVDSDFAIEATGEPIVAQRLVSVSKAGAKILILGLPLTEPTPVIFGDIVGYDKTLLGSIASASRDWEEAIHILALAGDTVDSLIGKEFKLSDYKKAWDMTNKKKYPRVLINLNISL